MFHFRAEKELFKCKNAKYSHIISTKDVVIASQMNQIIDRNTQMNLDDLELSMNSIETTTKKIQVKKRRSKLQNAYRSKKLTNALLSRYGIVYTDYKHKNFQPLHMSLRNVNP